MIHNNIYVKSILITALVLLSSASVAAEQPAGGFDAVASGALGLWSASDSVSADGSDYSLGGSVAYTDTSGWGGQLDLGYFKQQIASVSTFDRDAADLAAHLFYRSAGWLLGGIVQQRQYYGDNSHIRADETFTGVEGQLYLDHVTLQGQFGHERFDIKDAGLSANGYFGAVRVSYFIDDNLRLDGGIGIVRDQAPGADYEQTNLELGVEYRLQDRPVSLFAEYTKIHETDIGWKVDTDIALFGVRYNFGKATLLERSRSGAGLALAPRVLLW